MENILKRDAEIGHRDFDDLKYDLNSSTSEFDSMEIEEDIRNTSISTSGNDKLIKEEPNCDIQMDNVDILNIKTESVIDFCSEIILPQASHSQSTIPQKVKKEIKSKKEIEEEEREKMQ